ncbi:MAG: hypothetical protein VX888_03890 [Bacteroidota bacterium]|nr:hypothetical protein [Bacteroidota bacterium]
MKLLINNFVVVLLVVFLGAPEILDAQGYYNRYEYRRKRHEITFGAGASSCLTDVGGSDLSTSEFEQDGFKNTFRSVYDIDLAKTSFTGNFSYIYNLASKLTLRLNAAISQISGDDAQTQEFFRNNRRLNFNTFLGEVAFMSEFIIINERTGNRYNLKSPAGKYLGVKNPLGFGLYVFGGIGGVYFNPVGFDRFIDENINIIGSGQKYYLRDLRTEGQGTPGDTLFNLGETYDPVALCIPMGIGIKKAFNGNGGIKLEFGFRFTNTDYLDDVSGNYFDWASNGGSPEQITMSGTNTGQEYRYYGMANDDGAGGLIYPQGAVPQPQIQGGNVYYIDGFHYTKPGDQRGNPENDDSYMFLTLSAYKKFNNAAKSYRTINMHQKRKIKASF